MRVKQEPTDSTRNPPAQSAVGSWGQSPPLSSQSEVEGGLVPLPGPRPLCHLPTHASILTPGPWNTQGAHHEESSFTIRKGNPAQFQRIPGFTKMLRVSSQAFHEAQSPGPGAEPGLNRGPAAHTPSYRVATGGPQDPHGRAFPLAGPPP